MGPCLAVLLTWEALCVCAMTRSLWVRWNPVASALQPSPAIRLATFFVGIIHFVCTVNFVGQVVFFGPPV
jgi:hypothetical protein